MSNFLEVQLGETKTRLIDGDRSKRYPKREEYVDDGVMFLNAESINTGVVRREKVNFVSEAKYADITKGRISRNDVLMTTRGNGVGDTAFVNIDDRGLINAQMLILRVDPAEIHPRYLYYYLSGRTLRSYIRNFASGAAQPQLPIRDLRRIPIKLPDIKTQEKIAAILTAYDNLIGVNNRRINLLEAMANELFREWFVRKRFPEHQRAVFKKGVPSQWHVSTIGELCPTVTDGSHYSPANELGGRPMASVKDMTANGFNRRNMKTISDDDFERLVKSDCAPRSNDVLIAKDGSYLKHSFVWNHSYDLVVLSSIAILRPDTGKILPYFLSLVLRQDSTKSMMSGFVSGSALPRIILKDFKKMKLLIPEFSVMKSFERIVEPMFRKLNTLEDANFRLAKSRDLLLGRLVSGKIIVDQQHISFPPEFAVRDTSESKLELVRA